MRRIVILLVIAAFACFGCVMSPDRCADFGITPETPLGTLKCFDQRLGKLGLHQTPPLNMSLPEFGIETLPTISFVEQGKPSGLAGGESVSIFVDSQDAIRALLGAYKGSSEVHGAYTTVVSKFLVNYWTQLSGGNPSVASQLPDGRQRISMMSQGPVRGQWTKGTSLGQILVYVNK
ncbi:MAG: hypothetical protein K2Q17_15650 [Nitrospiraceae bacterium]|uniref:hypothetical protein n=1 Tax=Nitrospira cf. moscoviensis SBR1015 TaxID=96242 RepID=UPI001123299C|nr:hypothetical protein [Nitrospira cf. moscoviensis SBR1015]MBY0249093.1 hypothetical protein [Nitrospiraceae bacterium]